jgi:transposase
MTSLNRVTILGNVGRDPEVRQLQDGTKVCNLSVTTSDRWKDKATASSARRPNGIKGVIPSKRNRKAPIPHDRAAYRQRHLVENLFCRIKDFTRIVLRKCKTTRSYAGFVSLAFTLVNLQLCP